MTWHVITMCECDRVCVNVILWKAVGLGWADQVDECIRTVCVYLHTCHTHTLDASLGSSVA